MRTHGNKWDMNLGTRHGINLRKTCEGQTHGNYGNKIWNIWQRI
jgi:hypothetical protein